MIRVFKAAIYASVVASFLMLAFTLFRNPIDSYTQQVSSGLVIGVLITFSFGFISSLLFLLPLFFIHKKINHYLSAILFWSIGFSFSGWLTFELTSIPAHGSTPDPYSVKNLISVFGYAFAGGIGAIAAWHSLRKSEKQEHG